MAARSTKQYEQAVRSLQPYTPAVAGAPVPDVVVEFLEQPIDEPIRERLGDAGDGLHTGWDGRGLRLLHEGASCRLLFGDGGVRLELEPGFPWWRAFGQAIRPLLSVPIAAGGATVAHASAVTLDGQGIAIAGWAESGKTEVALALCERGARIVSDKWTALAADGTLHAMPVSAGLRAWTIPHLPALRGDLSAAQRSRAAVGRSVTKAVERLGGRAGGPAATAALGALRSAAALASRVSLSPADLRGDDEDDRSSAGLEVVVVLRAIDGPPAVRALDTRTARDRIATTTSYERHVLEQLDARSRYCGGPGIAGHAGLRARDETILEQVLDGCVVVELAAPFPADPRPAADALLTFLHGS
ncbi:MAG: hypothetical protein QOE31_3673 [Solirubrobacteraceae bacterium]|nr:hypothetical protein [Solirubrobacteraceae bacterium]